MRKKMNIPLSKVYVDATIKKDVMKVLDSGWFILGDRVREFEQRFAEFCGVKHAVCVSSGTTAIFLSLVTLGIKSGDEVIVPSFSFVATASPVLHVGAKPIFTDINTRTYTLDPFDVKKKIYKKTKAIIPVHLFGHPADMDPILEQASENDLLVIEDCCQAHGAEYKGKRVGAIGHIACFSFYPSKNMTVCGDGGIMTTNDEEIAQKLRMLRDHGRQGKYIHEIIGYNLRFNEIQAAIGIRQLEKLPYWNETRRRIAEAYNKALGSLVATPTEEAWARHVYHMYVIRTKKRNSLQTFLKKQGISTGIHYPVPIHKQPAIMNAVPGDFSLRNTDLVARTVLSLPMYPGLTMEEIGYVCEKISEFSEK